MRAQQIQNNPSASARLAAGMEEGSLRQQLEFFRVGRRLTAQEARVHPSGAGLIVKVAGKGGALFDGFIPKSKTTPYYRTRLGELAAQAPLPVKVLEASIDAGRKKLLLKFELFQKGLEEVSFTPEELQAYQAEFSPGTVLTVRPGNIHPTGSGLIVEATAKDGRIFQGFIPNNLAASYKGKLPELADLPEIRVRVIKSELSKKQDKLHVTYGFFDAQTEALLEALRQAPEEIPVRLAGADKNGLYGDYEGIPVFVPMSTVDPGLAGLSFGEWEGVGISAQILERNEESIQLRASFLSVDTTPEDAAGAEEKSRNDFLREEILAVRPNLLPLLERYFAELNKDGWAASAVKAKLRGSVPKSKLDGTADVIAAAAGRARGRWLEYQAQQQREKEKNRKKYVPPSRGTNLASKFVGEHPFQVRIFIGEGRGPALLAGEDGLPSSYGMFQYASPGTQQLLAEAGVRQGEFYGQIGRLGQRLHPGGRDPHAARGHALTILTGFDEKSVRAILQAAGTPALEAESLLALKRRFIEPAGAIAPNEAFRALMAHFRSPDGDYSNLVRSVNHVLRNEGSNPRLRGKTSEPISGIEGIDPEKGVELWMVKEGAFTGVFQVTVNLKDGRQVDLAVNAAKDRTKGADKLREGFAAMRRNYLFDPEFAVEIFEQAEAEGILLTVGEWADGFDELHLYVDNAPAFSRWKDNRINRDPLPGKTSAQIWYRAFWLQAYYTYFPEPGAVDVGTLALNRGDLTGAPLDEADPEGLWKLLIIWDRSRRHTDPYDLLLNSLLAVSSERTADAVQLHQVWLDQPAMAVTATLDGLAAHVRRQGALGNWPEDTIEQKTLDRFTDFLRGADQIILRWIEDPANAMNGRFADWTQFPEEGKRTALDILRRGHEEVKKKLRELEGTEQAAGAEEIREFESVGRFWRAYRKQIRSQGLLGIVRTLRQRSARLPMKVWFIPKGGRPAGRVVPTVNVYVFSAHFNDQIDWQTRIDLQLNQEGEDRLRQVFFAVNPLPSETKEDAPTVFIRETGSPWPADYGERWPVIVLDDAAAIKALSPYWVYWVALQDSLRGQSVGPVLGVLPMEEGLAIFA